MLKTIALVALFVISPYASGAHAHCQTVPKKDKTNRQHPDLQQLVIGINALQQSLPELTNAVNRLAVATENTNVKQPGPIDPPSPDHAIDSSGWLTLLAILIALSAYMANLRWQLIDKCGRQDSKKKKLWKKLQATTENSEQTIIKDKIEAADKKYLKYQAKIRVISLVDFLLAMAAIIIFLSLFGSHLFPARWSPFEIGLWFFTLAVFALLVLHAKEWLKTLSKMCPKNNKGPD